MKKTILVLSALLFVLVFSACDDSKKQAAQEAETIVEKRNSRT